MAKELKTGFKVIGRSGPTVDGRNIEPIALQQAAKNYKKELFTALIWPDHIRWFNMGTVEELRAVDNEEGGVDLLAIIAPNDIYLSTNSAGQRLFTSMELMPNFRDTGEYYLTGLAATDNPASAATSEMRFTSGADKAALLSTFTEHTPQQINDEQPPSWFQRFAEKFTKTEQSEEDAMDKKDKEAFEARFTALEKSIAALKPADKTDTQTPSEDFAAAQAKIEELSKQIEAFTTEKAGTVEQLKKLTEDFTALQTEFKAAVSEQKGTDAGEHFSAGTDESIQTDC